MYIRKCTYDINHIKLTRFCSSASLQTNDSKFANEVTLNLQSLNHANSRHENPRKGFVCLFVCFHSVCRRWQACCCWRDTVANNELDSNDLRSISYFINETPSFSLLVPLRVPFLGVVAWSRKSTS